jgi:hypothetical protein
MKTTMLTGIILIVLAVLAFSYQGITYTKREKVLDIGPFQATAERRESIPIPPLLAGAALMGGVALILVGSKR